MKALLTSLILITTFTSYITCIEIDPTLFDMIAFGCPLDIKEKILLEYSQNVHRYVNEKFGAEKARLASRIIWNVSLVNKSLYTQLEQTRNNPIIARTIINELSFDKNDHFDSIAADTFSFPGAQKSLHLSKTLYDDGLTIDLLEYLHQQGACLDYWHDEKNTCPANYWNNYTRRDNPKSATLVKKFLELGIHIDQTNLISQSMIDKNLELLEMIFHYYCPKNKCWGRAIDFPECIDLLITYSTKEDLDHGLKICIQHSNHVPEIMQKLIDKGANPSEALQYLESSSGTLLDSNTTYFKNFIFLCENQAFNQETHNKMQNMMNNLTILADKLEQNQPK